MNRVLILLFFVLMFSIVSSAAGSTVVIIKVHYEDNSLEIVDSDVKPGNYPDRKVQPEEGYILEVVDEGDNILYSFKFLVPDKLFVDSGNADGTISGGVIKLFETDFALVLPYFDSTKDIRIIGEDNIVQDSYDIQFEEAFAPAIRRVGFFSLILILFGIAGFFVFMHLRKRV